MVITGGDWDNIDNKTYTENAMNKAFDAIRKAQNAEENFNAGNSSDADSWGAASSFDENAEDTPW